MGQIDDLVGIPRLSLQIAWKCCSHVAHLTISVMMDVGLYLQERHPLLVTSGAVGPLEGLLGVELRVLVLSVEGLIFR